MKKSEKEKPQVMMDEAQLSIKDKQLVKEEEDTDGHSPALPYSNSTIALMPELEELVKKNPNRLIGCGG